MKKPLLLIAAGAAALLTLLLAGCSKKNNGSTYSMASVAGAYKLTGATYTLGGSTQSAMGFFDACQLDDILELGADSSLLYTDAGTVCTPDGSYSGQWYISGSYLIQITDQGRDTATIKSFNGTSLVASGTGDFLGTPVIVTTTMTKQ